MLENRDLVIIGAGPAALTAAIYAARAGHRPTVYTGTVQPGGDLTTTTTVDNFPGFPSGVDGPELIADMRVQAERFGAIIVFEDVTGIDVPRQQLTLGSGTLVSYDAAILATGSEYRKLGIGREQELTGRGVSYCATCDGVFFRGDDVAVAGGGDTAMEEALFLSAHAATVTILARGALRASQAMVERVQRTPNITVRSGATVTALHTQNEQLAGITVRTDEQDELLHVTGLFIAIGSDPRTDLVAGQVQLTEHGTVAVRGRSAYVSDTRHEVPGLFAAGDIIDPTYRQAITAAGSGAVAGIDAAKYLDERAGAV